MDEDATEEVFANLMLFNLKASKRREHIAKSETREKGIMNWATAKIAVNSIRLGFSVVFALSLPSDTPGTEKTRGETVQINLMWC